MEPAQRVPIGTAARLLGVSVDTVRRWTEATPPKIPFTRTAGGDRRFLVADIDEFLKNTA